MVGHDLHFHQPCPFLVHHLADEVLQTFFDPAAEHATPVLRAPHNVEGALKGDVAVRPQGYSHSAIMQLGAS
ncbi:hypothetical protein GCM10017673_38280 [Streptosporangium violaceochromogenes]|nr:hypothetical protein GCM10017673_38280 [Streptosporangium violaceochromogenes]